MPSRSAAYPPVYREQIIALARAGRSSRELAKEFEPPEQTIRNWISQAEADRGERPVPSDGAESTVGRGYHVRPHGCRIPLSRCGA